MSILAHADHTATVYRQTTTRSAALRVPERSWAAIADLTDIELLVQLRSEVMSDDGPGERVVGQYLGFGAPAWDIREGDVIDVSAGPDAPLQLRVTSATRPRNHHLELVMEPWEGSLS